MSSVITELLVQHFKLIQSHFETLQHSRQLRLLIDILPFTHSVMNGTGRGGLSGLASTNNTKVFISKGCSTNTCSASFTVSRIIYLPQLV